MNFLLKKRQLTYTWISALIIAMAALVFVSTFLYADKFYFNPVKFDEFTLLEHEKDSKYVFTISFRGERYVVSKEEEVFDVSTGERIIKSQSEYSQIFRCIRMYQFHKGGVTGKSPAELRNGELKLNQVSE